MFLRYNALSEPTFAYKAHMSNTWALECTSIR